MARFFKDRTKLKGKAPGSLILVGEQKMPHPVFQLMQYDAESLVEKECKTIDEAMDSIGGKKVTWINIYGLHDLGMMRKIEEKLNLPDIVMEDILNTDQRPKYVEGESTCTFILKYLSHDTQTNEITAEQVSIILGKNYVLTLQEKTGNFLEPLRERIRSSTAKKRLLYNDYLAFAILDAMVDTYADLIEKTGVQVENLEDRIFKESSKALVEEMYRLKTEINFIRKAVRPVKEITSKILNADSTLFRDETKDFIQNLNGLALQLSETIELYGSLISDQHNIYSTKIGNNLNEVMKVLTIFASIFIPLTFIAGIYGTNFDILPELHFKYSYFIMWGVMIMLAAGMLMYFKKKKWF